MVNISQYKNNLSLFSVSILQKYNPVSIDRNHNSTIWIIESWYKNIDNFSHVNQDLDFLSKQFDIKGKVYKTYDSKWKNKGEDCLNLDLLQVLAGFLFFRVLLANGNCNEGKLAKYINVCWKIFESIELPEFLKKDKNILHLIQNEMHRRILNDGEFSEKPILKENLQDSFEINNQFKILPINVLFYENPIGRAYLEMLYSLRLKPKKIIHLIPERDIVSKRKIGRFLPLKMRQKYIHNIQVSKISYWPRYFIQKHKDLCDILFKELQESLHIKNSSIIGLAKIKPLESFSDEIIQITYDGFKDERFLDAIKLTESEFSLFTGGGIIPKNIFDETNAKLLHIHPGFLPDIRGADCFYWSLMLAQRPSASCFIMNSGIDTGEIINAKFLPKLRLLNCTKGLTEEMIYRLIYSFVDPWIRAAVLKDTILNTNNFTNVESFKQDGSEGTTFHFMHKNMREEIVKSFF